jgi:hypothetical protein
MCGKDFKVWGGATTCSSVCSDQLRDIYLCEYRNQNRDKRRAYQLIYYIENRERISERASDWRIRNNESIRIRERERANQPANRKKKLEESRTRYIELQAALAAHRELFGRQPFDHRNMALFKKELDRILNDDDGESK